MAPLNRLMVTNIFLNIFFCVQQLKPTHTGLKQLEDKYIMTELDFIGKLHFKGSNLIICVFFIIYTFTQI